ncbi:hypothetical protein PC128_g15100 [Phytophthora cactorum]|nr:hypothetical protein PC121_g12981 [Phytophthora cactorum]KAG3181515.1 hypothetical protein PC128_g15100 [Phytophthora cactorum]KAG4052672.1 hypothetical protein PC123_g12154 [Phytophthora cactorum]
MEKEEEKDSSLELLGSPTLQNLWNEGKMDDDELLLSPIHSGSGDVSQYSLRQVDRFRMTAINQSSSDTDPKRKYCDCGEWICVITSEYGLRELGTIVKPSYYMYEELWSKGHMLGGRRVAFKNYVHTMARDGEEIELQLRPYDRSKTDQHTYAAVKLKASKLRNDGRNAAECKAIMQILWDVDYWYPLDRCLATIDSAAMLTIGLFPQGTARYIVLVPDMETSDKFRLSLADPPTQVLYRSMERIIGSDACLSQVFVTVRCGTGPRIVGY